MSDELIIEDGIPIPQHGNARPAGIGATLRRMKVGQSVWAAGEMLYGHTHRAGKQIGGKFVTRREVRNGVKGARAWRVE